MKNESTPKNQSAPKSPEGDFLKMLIFNISPFRAGQKNTEYQYYALFGVDSRIKISFYMS
jgi:hypothetical protein